MPGTKRSKIKKNDQVVIIAGRDKGRRGRVLEVAPAKGKVKVEGMGMIKRHQKANPQANRGGVVAPSGRTLQWRCRGGGAKPPEARAASGL